MKLNRSGKSAFTITLAARELPALIAAVRLAAEVLERSEQAPSGAVAQVRALLSDYEREIARLDEEDERQGRPS